MNKLYLSLMIIAILIGAAVQVKVQVKRAEEKQYYFLWYLLEGGINVENFLDKSPEAYGK
jgi:hypothetical protein